MPTERPTGTPTPQLSLGPEGSGLLIYHDGGKTKSKYLDPTFSQAGIKLELPVARSPARGLKATLVFFFESNMEPTGVKVVESPGLEGVSATVAAGKATPGAVDSSAAPDYRKYELTVELETAAVSSQASDYALDLRLLYENGFIPVKVTGMYPPPTPIASPTNTPRPVVWVTLGVPFAPDCGDGVARIWSNDSFNGPFRADGFDDHHGHVDIFVPAGCDVNAYQGEVLAPVSGRLQLYPDGTGYHLIVPRNTYVRGVEEALKFAGVKDPKVSLIQEIRFHFGHLRGSVRVPTSVVRGQSIGDVIIDHNQQKVGYQITVAYGGAEYMLSPTLFSQDGPAWVCVVDSHYDCEPQPMDYAR